MGRFPSKKQKHSSDSAHNRSRNQLLNFAMEEGVKGEVRGLEMVLVREVYQSEGLVYKAWANSAGNPSSE